MSIEQNLNIIKEKITNAKENAGIKSQKVQLMAVSKFHSSEEIEQAVRAGQLLFGENRVQEANEKFPQLFEKYPDIQLHIIGQLQSNKVKTAVKLASCIQSVDRFDLLQEIEKQCAKIDKKIQILFEVHTGEESKSGYTSMTELEKSLEACVRGEFPHIIPSGFMTMAPFTEDKTLIRKSFSTLKNMSIELQEKYKSLNLKELSMGMSGDFEIAIEEGSTLVRVGTAIFGQRDYSKK